MKTDAEKIEFLATKLDEAATYMYGREGLADELGAVREERDDFERKCDELRGKLDKIHDLAK